MKILTNEERKAIIRLKEKEEKNEVIAEIFEINISTITRIWSRYKNTGKYEKLPANSGRKGLVTEEQMASVEKQIHEKPDTTLQELIEKFQLNISVPALSKRLKKLGYTFKKRLYSQKHNNDQM